MLKVFADVVSPLQSTPLGSVDEAHVVSQIESMGGGILVDLLWLLGLRQ